MNSSSRFRRNFFRPFSFVLDSFNFDPFRSSFFRLLFNFKTFSWIFCFRLKLEFRLFSNLPPQTTYILKKIQFFRPVFFNKRVQPKSSDFRAVSSKTVSEHNVFCRPFFLLQPISILIFKNAHFLNTTDYSFQNMIFQASDL